MSDAGDVTPSHEPYDSEDDQSTPSSSPTVKFAGSPLLNSPTSKAAGSRVFSPDQPSPKRRRTGSERQDAAASPASAAGKSSCSTPSADADILLPRVSEQPSEDCPEPGRPRKDLEEEEREKMQVLVSYFTEDQLDRYEMYRRSAFPKAAIKRVMQTLTTCSVSQNAVIAMSGISKVFVGEIMEQALDVKEECGDTGPVQPKHLREAVRRLRADVNSCSPSVKLGRPTVQL